MAKSKLGVLMIIIGISSTIMGTWFYQNALAGVMNQIALGNLVADYISNLHYMSLMAVGGLLFTIIGASLKFSNK